MLPNEPLQHGYRALQQPAIRGFQRSHGVRERGDAAGATLLQQALPRRGCLHPLDPAVGGIGTTPHEPVALELLDEPRNGRRPHLLGLRERAQGDRTAEDDHRQGGQPGSGEAAGLVLRSQPAQQVDGRGVQPVGERLGPVTATGGWSGGLTARGHDPIVSLANKTVNPTTPELAMAATRTVALDTLGQIALTVTDIDRATAFYRDTLGMPFLFAFPGLAFFTLGDVRLMLSLPEGSDPRTMASPLYFRVRDIAAVHQTLTDRGVAFRDEPHVVHRDATMELWMTFFDDPDGNLLALMEETTPA